MQLIVKTDEVLATHEDSQDVLSLYPDSTVLIVSGDQQYIEVTETIPQGEGVDPIEITTRRLIRSGDANPALSMSTEDLVAVKKATAKWWCQKVILNSVPDFKQRNAALGLYSEETTVAIRTFVGQCRDTCATHEDLISAADHATLITYDITADWPEAIVVS